MKRLRIREAMIAYNIRAKAEGAPKMTLGRLAKKVFMRSTTVNEKTGLRYLSQWSRGENIVRVEDKHKARICEHLCVPEHELVEAE